MSVEITSVRQRSRPSVPVEITAGSRLRRWRSRMLRTVRPKPSGPDDKVGAEETAEETGSFDRAIAITRYGMKLLGFWPLNTRLLCDLQCGAIFVLISFFTFPAAVRTYTVVSTVTDWDLVMHQALETVPMIPLLARFIFMKVMARNFRFVLHSIIIDWASYRYLAQRGRRIMTYYARRGRQFSILSTALMMLSIAGFDFSPILNMWRNDSFWNVTTRTLPHEGFYPFRNKESPAFEILYITQSFMSFLSALALTTVDCFLYIIMFHVCGQFDILAATLERYNVSVRHDYTKDARDCACLSCIVKQHVHILK